jgi:hypothetical protein
MLVIPLSSRPALPRLPEGRCGAFTITPFALEETQTLRRTPFPAGPAILGRGRQGGRYD